MSGNWAGSGIITFAGGNQERIRCRARYDVDGGGSNLGLTLRCASDSYNFELQSNATHNNGAVSGNWSENTRHVSGNIEGRAHGNAIIGARVRAASRRRSASAPTATSSQISIQAPGTEMSSAAISLSRSANHSSVRLRQSS